MTTLEQLKSAMSELSYNNTIEIVVSGTIEISETLLKELNTGRPAGK